jgi:DNA-binding response OmpR family regulator
MDTPTPKIDIYLGRNRRILVCGQEKKLTDSEADLFEFLATRVGHWNSKPELMEYMYDNAVDPPFHDIIQVFIHRIRTKIPEVQIEQCHRLGYRIFDATVVFRSQPNKKGER